MAKAYKIMAVDDNPMDRELVATLLEIIGYDCETVSGGEEALRKLSPAVDLLLVDGMMPGMDGFELARRVRTKYLDLPIMMITALSSKEDRLRAVEAGANDFINKPLEKVELKVRVGALLRTRDAQQAVKDLWRHTLRGSVKLLSDMLAIVKPNAYGRASRVAPYVRSISAYVSDPNPWITETAALLSVLSFLTLPDNLIRRACKGKPLSTEEVLLIRKQREIAAEWIKNIPRMEAVAEIILCQEKHYDGSGYPLDNVQGDSIPLGARINSLVSDFDTLVFGGATKTAAFKELNNRKGWYDAEVLYAFGLVLGDEAKQAIAEKRIDQLKPGMVLAEDVFTANRSRKLIGRGQELSATMIDYLFKYQQGDGVTQPIRVIPSAAKDSP